MSQASQTHKLQVHGVNSNDSVLPRNILAIPSQAVTDGAAYGPIDLGASTYWSEDTTITNFTISPAIPTGMTFSATTGALGGTTTVVGTTTHYIVAKGDEGISVNSNKFTIVVT